MLLGGGGGVAPGFGGFGVPNPYGMGAPMLAMMPPGAAGSALPGGYVAVPLHQHQHPPLAASPAPGHQPPWAAVSPVRGVHGAGARQNPTGVSSVEFDLAAGAPSEFVPVDLVSPAAVGGAAVEYHRAPSDASAGLDLDATPARANVTAKPVRHHVTDGLEHEGDAQ
jgi:hypothetical protein